ncbi:PREDICTED: putative F-box/FBD/LRR-repeat protein At1g16940 [Camelina sativa]|uniref:F-box/FBD/LRR-repeat protein At1g16940 n=1 Tax=Camelina sativa TaxID=90675 RepID=A0ABM1QF76_CAMSA|nr:PREDICTED: putative F-box/FBD/LRR-repeat protein At1g16940 [Camelina sativa]
MKSEKKPVGDSRIGEEDRISRLPDSLLCEILLNFPTKDVIKTSLLCRRWRYIWRYVPVWDLQINGGLEDAAKFSFFKRFMDFNSSVCLQRVKLRYVGYSFGFRDSKLINIVFKHKIQHLDLEGYTRDDTIKIPPTIYTSCERLVSLKLRCLLLPKPPKSVSLPCLKIIDLQEIKFDDSSAMEVLISGCSALESLTMDKMYGDRVSSQSLLSFCLTKTEGGDLDKKTVTMQAPRLKFIKLNNRSIERFIVKDLGSIIKLDLDGFTNFGETLHSFLTLLSFVRDITISSDILKVLHKFSESESLPQFHNLSSLSIKAGTLSWEYLLTFLENCPNLKYLVMTIMEDDDVIPRKHFALPRRSMSSYCLLLS